MIATKISRTQWRLNYDIDKDKDAVHMDTDNMLSKCMSSHIHDKNNNK